MAVTFQQRALTDPRTPLLGDTPSTIAAMGRAVACAKGPVVPTRARGDRTLRPGCSRSRVLLVCGPIRIEGRTRPLDSRVSSDMLQCGRKPGAIGVVGVAEADDGGTIVSVSWAALGTDEGTPGGGACGEKRRGRCALRRAGAERARPYSCVGILGCGMSQGITLG